VQRSMGGVRQQPDRIPNVPSSFSYGRSWPRGEVEAH
jgi:hypothetical protein